MIYWPEISHMANTHTFQEDWDSYFEWSHIIENYQREGLLLWKRKEKVSWVKGMGTMFITGYELNRVYQPLAITASQKTRGPGWLNLFQCFVHSYLQFHPPPFLIVVTKQTRNWKDSSIVKSPCCSSRGPKFGSQVISIFLFLLLEIQIHYSKNI